MQRAGAHLYFEFATILCCISIILMIATHPPACSAGDTPLKQAILYRKSDVVALLRSVGASQ